MGGPLVRKRGYARCAQTRIFTCWTLREIVPLVKLEKLSGCMGPAAITAVRDESLNGSLKHLAQDLAVANFLLSLEAHSVEQGVVGIRQLPKRPIRDLNEG